MSTILFEPVYNIGDIVCLKIAPENKFVVCGYQIRQINKNGEATFWMYELYDSEGTTYQYCDIDLQLIESVNHG